MIRCTGAELTIALLERQGITQIAGIPGGTNLPLYDALSGSPIRHVLARHEQGAGFIAQGMARATGKPAVAFATSGPGATNLLTALADAMLDSVPLVCITGQVPQALIGTNAFQEVDICAMSRPVTKANYLVSSAEQLLQLIPEAFALAASGRPGPVLIDIPKDVQMQGVEFAAWPSPGEAAAPVAPPLDELEAACALIAEAERPVLYLGGGVRHAGAEALARQLAEHNALPTVMTLMALGTLAHDHPLALGMLGMHGAQATNHALQESDLLIVVGARFDDRATGRIAEFCPAAKVIHLDVDSRELHKLRRADVALHGDLRPGLEGLLARLDARERSAWWSRIASLRLEYPEPDCGSQLSEPRALIRAVGEALGADALVVTDVGQHQMWTAQCYPFTHPRQWLTSGGLGTMGFGLPAAIGAALAMPGRAVVCFSGDGSIMMNLQELATVKEQGLDIKLILLDNRALGLVRQQQDLFYGGRRYASDFDNCGIDFSVIAQGFGWQAVDLGRAQFSPEALAAALAQPGPVLVRVPIDGDARVYPMVPPGGANHQMLTEPTQGVEDGSAPVREAG